MNAPKQQGRMHLPPLSIAAATLLLQGMPLSVSPAQGETVSWQERVAAGIEKTLARERPKWKPEDRTEFAREVAAHFVEVTPEEALPRRSQAFLDAFRESVQTTHEELSTPSVLPHDIAELKWRIDLWSRRGDVNPAEQDAIVRQLREIFEWGGAEIQKAKPKLSGEQLSRSLQDRLREAEQLCRNPLSAAYQRALTARQVQEVKDRFRKRLDGAEPPAGRRPGDEADWYAARLAAAIASVNVPLPPQGLRELGHRVSLEQRERHREEDARRDAEGNRLLLRSAEMSEPFEWVGWLGAQFLMSLTGQDGWQLSLW